MTRAALLALLLGLAPSCDSNGDGDVGNDGGDGGEVACGNGAVEPGEACDDGFADACGSCNADCTGEGAGSTCGDGEECPETEACNDGLADACFACNADCTGAGEGSTCGDGEICAETEACDDGFADACGACNADCTFEGAGATCGDGEVCPESEYCDDGYADSCGTCNATCLGGGGGETCGDGEHCPQTEACDDGFLDACGTCNVDCTAAGAGSTCGDDMLCAEVEACDDGNALGDDGCSADCTVDLSVCGNGAVEWGEACDDENTLGGDGCSADCATDLATCGNGDLEWGEVCDDENIADGDGCAMDCLTDLSVCGNGVFEWAEVCDDGDGGEGDFCSGDCQAVFPSCEIDDVEGLPASGSSLVASGEDFVPLCDGLVLLGDSSTHSVELLDATTGTVSVTYALAGAPAALALDASSGALFAAIDASLSVARIDLATGVQTTVDLAAPVLGLAGGSGYVFASIGESGEPPEGALILLDGVSAAPLGSSSGPFPALLAYEPAGSQVFTVDAMLRRYAYDLVSREATLAEERVDVGAPCEGLAVSPDGARVAVACDAGDDTIRDYASGDLDTIIGTWDLGAAPRAIAFSPDSASLAASDGAVLMTFEVESHAPVDTITLGFSGCAGGEVHKVGFSRGGQLVFALARCGDTGGKLFWARLEP